MTTDPRIAAFYAADKPWSRELGALRDRILTHGYTEEYKWRSPCYTYKGQNVAMIWGLSDAATLSFFKGVLIDDPYGTLEAPGKNSRSARYVKFGSLQEIKQKSEMIAYYFEAAKTVEDQGRKVAFDDSLPDYPEELSAYFDADPDLEAAFNALTRGRQRGYLLHFSEAKQAKTRTKRIAKHAPRILAGKGMHDR